MNNQASQVIQINTRNDGWIIKLIKPDVEKDILEEYLSEMGLKLQSQMMDKILAAPTGTEFHIKRGSDLLTETRIWSDNLPFEITVSPDKMKVFLTLNPRLPIKPRCQDLVAALNNMGISYGIDESNIDYAINNTGQTIVVAQGKYPVPGKNGSVQYLYHKPIIKPVLDESGQVDYYELGFIIPIKAGTLLARRKAATEGEAGINVFGEPIPAKPGRNYKFNVGKGIITTKDKAIAEFDGALAWINDKIVVTKMLAIKGDIDFSTGNICFPGKIIIEGSVKDGFVVEAEDDIEVRGGIEAARVVSQHGSVFVQKGIIGGGKAQVKAGKNVEARFIQEAMIEAGQNIIINEYTVRSNLKAGDGVLIQGRRGIILGRNIISARTRIKASRVLNCPALDLRVKGIERKQFYAQIKELNSRIDQLDMELKKTAEQIRYLRDKSSEQNSLQQLQETLPQYMDMKDELDRLYEERRSLVNMLKSTRGEGMIEIGGGLETGMTFGIKEDFVKIDQQAESLRMYYDPDKGRIVILE
ncbi:DUF342 domain-containing protein [Syntrophomonas wolfei]|uniref:Flagellar Assembly Protein A N-terminal region domain-containing protein n=1 Tax=Syntrophomonas wolfei subsp. wolfei (strain DSM 2245B / Goettingen) TaxID=335541 RepID=Q0AWU0_SYNWW|nr:FapA family protein [Syntrophomonas wolfei]ABI68814.1 hypothetical protein Swol_1511 [Syntrophomonas wolfei subsp. wolfei str. Goettingen G311]